jgi:hypothetical protein
MERARRKKPSPVFVIPEVRAMREAAAKNKKGGLSAALHCRVLR